MPRWNLFSPYAYIYIYIFIYLYLYIYIFIYLYIYLYIFIFIYNWYLRLGGPPYIAEIAVDLQVYRAVVSKNCCSSADSNSCQSSESGALSLSSAARHIDFHLLRRIYVVLVAHSIALSLHYLLLYGGNVLIAALDQWRHFHFPRFGSIVANAKCSEPKIATPQRTRTHVRESRVRRVIIEQRRGAYWFPFIAPYLSSS